MPWELATLVYPLMSIVCASAGFLFGLPVARWQGVCGLATAILLSLVGVNTRVRRAQKLAAVIGTIGVSIALAGVSVMYSTVDAEVYHRPASMLMAAGWNPVFDSTVESVEALRKPEEAMRVGHVTYLPRAFWIFGAVLYRNVGFVEAGDAFNVLTCILSYFMMSRLLARTLGMRGTSRGIAAVLISLSPVVVSLLFGGMCDSSFYSLFLISCAAATLYALTGGSQWLCYVTATLPLLANLKFTGVICCLVITVVFFVACVEASRRRNGGSERAMGWLGMIVASAGLSAVIGFSPYITNWVRHGGPLYPAHSFDPRVPSSNVLTADFLSMNQDARQMGYVGRFGYAYLSQWVTLSLYGQGSDGGRFAPRFDVSGGVGGFGPVFRVAFVLSLILMPFVRVGRMRWFLACVVLTVLLQPTMYVGYARYVPQFYAFPLIIFFAAAQQLTERARRDGAMSTRNGVMARWTTPSVVSLTALLYCLPLLAYPLSFLGLQWVISVQNLEITKALRADPAPVVLARSYYSRHTLQNDHGCDAIRFLAEDADIQAETVGRLPYSPYFSYYTYFAPAELKDVPILNHTVSRNDPAIIATRNRRNMRYFLVSFLPTQLPRLPRYLLDVAILRCRQFSHAWRLLGEGP